MGKKKRALDAKLLSMTISDIQNGFESKKHMKRVVYFQFKSKLIKNGQNILTAYCSYKSLVGDLLKTIKLYN